MTTHKIFNIQVYCKKVKAYSNHTNICLQVGQVLWLANHWSIQTLLKECRPPQSDSCNLSLIRFPPSSPQGRFLPSGCPPAALSPLPDLIVCRNRSSQGGLRVRQVFPRLFERLLQPGRGSLLQHECHFNLGDFQYIFAGRLPQDLHDLNQLWVSIF